MKLSRAVSAIEKHGILLVYPIQNQKEPASLWSCFYPRSEMKWEWDQEGDQRVAELWHLKQKLSESGEVVYTKWYRGRATFFSKEVFTAALCLLRTSQISPQTLRLILSSEAWSILEVLKMDSPLSTKQLKKLTDLRGRALEPLYTKALKALWSRLLIVGFGEIEDGAFPSLAIGSTQNLFEELWLGAKKMKVDAAEKILRNKVKDQAILKFLSRTLVDVSSKSLNSEML